MIPRGVLDIDVSMLLGALVRSFASSSQIDELARLIERAWDHERSSLTCLSVRSGFDALLTAMSWPSGSEVLMSAVTIPDMPRIVEAQGLVPVPVDVDPDSLAPDLTQWQSCITPRTRAIVVAHLFGSRLDLTDLAAMSRAHGLELWEDVAQGFADDGFRGDSLADVSLFSFGLIKAQTAVGGAVLRFRDPDLATACRTVQAGWPIQSSQAYRKKVVRGLLLHALTQRPLFTLMANTATRCGIDLDERLSRSVRGFAGADLFTQLRRRPCHALLDRLQRRLAHSDFRWMTRKTALAERYRELLPARLLLGTETAFPTHWVLPIRSRDPLGLRQRLWRAGYDATTRSSQLRVIAAPAGHPTWTTPQSSAWLPQLIYLPLHPALKPAHVNNIAAIIQDFEGRASYQPDA